MENLITYILEPSIFYLKKKTFVAYFFFLLCLFSVDFYVKNFSLQIIIYDLCCCLSVWNVFLFLFFRFVFYFCVANQFLTVIRRNWSRMLSTCRRMWWINRYFFLEKKMLSKQVGFTIINPIIFFFIYNKKFEMLFRLLLYSL